MNEPLMMSLGSAENTEMGDRLYSAIRIIDSPTPYLNAPTPTHLWILSSRKVAPHLDRDKALPLGSGRTFPGGDDAV